MTGSSYISTIQTLNECIAQFYSADEQDLAVLGSILVRLDEILDDKELPENFILDCRTFNEKLGAAMLDGTAASVIAEAPSVLTELISILDADSSEVEHVDLTEKQKLFAIENISVEIEKVNELEECMLGYESQENTSDWETIRANLHSLKGDFGVIGLSSFVELTHKVEDVVLNASEEDRKTLTPLVLAYKDVMIAKINDIMDGDFSDISMLEISNVLAVLEKSESSDEEEITITRKLEVSGEDTLLVEFITESKEHVVSAEAALIELENDPANDELINAAFRSCHTIKGVAGFLNLTPIQELGHTLENIMDAVRMGKLAMNAEISTSLLAGFDQLGILIEIVESNLPSGEKEIPEKTVEVYRDLEKLKAELDSKTSDKTPDKQVTPKEVLVENTIVKPEPKAPVKPVVTQSEAPVKPSAAPVKVMAPQKQNEPKAKAATKVEETVRVSVQRLDRLIDSIGEIVIAQSMLTADPDFVKLKTRGIEQKATQISMVMRQIQEEAMALRMVSLKSTFQKMNRLVRDLSQKMGKPVNFKISGEDTELDKSIIEHIGDPLVHMLRNSIDHGLENSEDRVAAGKENTGTVELHAYHKSGNVVIDIVDDGRGLSRNQILNKAIENGIANPNHDYTDDEVNHFIFEPGFSTAAEITDISGRGVGMDVVKRNIVGLRGKLDIISEEGKGTTFSIKLPLTMAIIDGMVVSAGGQTLILPTLSIISTVNPAADQIQSVRGKGEMLHLHNELYRFVRLADLLNIETEEADVSTGIAILVENISGQKVALWVDTIIKKQQVVIKSMGPLFEGSKWISGGAILGDGKVNLILDVNELFQLMEK